MAISPRQLAASLIEANHIADRHMIAAFVVDAATQPAPNPFPQTSVGAVRQAWGPRVVEFQSFDIQAAGLGCLLRALSEMRVDEPLVQEILRAGPHTVNLFHRGDGFEIVGAVLYGQPKAALPEVSTQLTVRSKSRSSRRSVAAQLEFFV